MHPTILLIQFKEILYSYLKKVNVFVYRIHFKLIHVDNYKLIIFEWN